MKNKKLILCTANFRDRHILKDTLFNLRDEFEFILANNLAQVKQLVKENNFDLVLSDFMLPGLEDFEIMNTVKELNATLPVIIITGRGSEEIAAKSIEMGASAYVIESATQIHKLATAIRQVLEYEKSRNANIEILSTLHESDKRFRLLLENSLDAIMLTEQDGGILKANAAACRMFGRMEGDLQRLGREGIIDTTDPRFSKAIGERSATGKFQGELTGKRKNGDLFPIELSSALFSCSNGRKLSSMIIRDISERKQAEASLAEYHLLLKTLLNAIPAPVFYKDIKGKYTVTNKAFEIFHGKTKQELSGKTVFDLATRELATIYHQKDLELFRQPGIQVYDMQVDDCKGITHDMVFHKAATLDCSGNVIGLIGVMIDITERKKTEDALFASEKKYHSIFENVQDVYYETMLDGTILEVSPSIMHVSLGQYSRGNLIGKSMYDYYADAADRDKVLAEMQKTGKITDFEVRFKSSDSSVILCSISAKLGLNESGQAEKIIGSLHNITKRRLAEDALRESEKRYQTLTEISPVGIFRTDAKGSTTYVNPHWSMISGLSSQEAMGDGWLAAVHPDDKRELFSCWKTATCSQQVSASEYRFIHPDGSISWVIGNAVPEKDSSGNTIAYVGTITDITSRKMAEENIKELNEILEQRVTERTQKLEAANMELDAFSYSVSHDLRSPLRAIHGFTQILMEDYARLLDDEGKRFCTIIRDNAVKMGELIDDLLAFSRLSRAEILPSSINMKELITTVYRELTDPGQDNRIDFTVGDICDAPGDATLIKQVWVNLISNALKYSSKKEKAIISVTCSKQEQKYTYCITDNGAGFDMKYIDKMFGVFKRFHNAKDFEGTGVGLAIVQRIILSHGGEVWATGEVKKGASFCFSLPVIADRVY